MSARINLTGKKFGRLTVLKFSHVSRHNKACWDCICGCGNLTNVISISLINGNTKSCGCYAIQKTIESVTKHGHSRVGNQTKTYRAWARMNERCSNIKSKDYKDYGGRGIFVCEDWKNDFIKFLYDMGECPDLCSIERINVNGNYEKTNCKWATAIEQANNKRNSKRLEYNGINITVSEWARKIGMHRGSLQNRIDKNWPIEMILTTKLFKPGPKK